MGVETCDLRMVAAHAWDIVGAMQAGCAGAFISRPGKVIFPLGPQPDVEGPGLSTLARPSWSANADCQAINTDKWPTKGNRRGYPFACSLPVGGFPLLAVPTTE